MNTRWLRLGRSALARHGTVAAYLALILASGAATYAANTIGSVDIIDGSIQSVDMKNGDLTGADLANDTLGGAQVDESALVAAKLHGMGVGTYSGRSSTKAKPANNSIFLAPSGLSSPVAGSDAAVRFIAPATALRARGLIVTESDQKASDGMRTYSLRINGVDTTLRCHVTGAAKTCSNTVAVVTLPPGSTMSLHLVRAAGGTRTASNIQFAFRTVTP